LRIAPVQGRQPAEKLRGLASSVLLAVGLRSEDAETVADVLVDADLRDLGSHGLIRLADYVARFESGVVNKQPMVAVVSDHEAIVHLDGDHGHGMVVAKMAAQIAIERAKRYGVGAVSVRRSGHFGQAGYFTRMMTDAGCAGLAFTNASPAIAPCNGAERLLGNNPWSIAVPGREGAICLDMANSVAARGKMMVAARDGVPIPEGWAVDELGEPTTDPTAALRGAAVAIAGHKGYAITVMVEILASVLSGASYLDDVASPRFAEGVQDVGHLFIAIDIEKIMPLPEFLLRITDYRSRIKTSKAAPGKEIFMPGEPELRAIERNLRDGILLGDTWGVITALCEKYGVPA